MSESKMRSDMITKGVDRAPHRSLLRAAGVKEEDFGKPFIAVCNSYIDIVPGYVHLQEFGKIVKEAIREAGGVPFEFNTIGVDDGIAMGHIVCAILYQVVRLLLIQLKQLFLHTGLMVWFVSETVTKLHLV